MLVLEWSASQLHSYTGLPYADHYPIIGTFIEEDLFFHINLIFVDKVQERVLGAIN